MKNRVFILGFFVCFCLSAFIGSIPDKTKLITRRWILIDFYTPRIERNFEQLGISPERRIVVIKKLVNGSFVDFKTNGTYEASILGSTPETLYWRLDSDSILLVSKSNKVQYKEIEIESLTKKELVMLLPDVAGEVTRMTFVPDPTFAKLDDSEE